MQTIADTLNILVARGAEHVPSSNSDVGGVVGGSGSQLIISQEEDRTNIYEGSSGDELEEGRSDHGAFTGAGGPDQWFMPKTDWQPFWDEHNEVVGFLIGNEVVPGSMEFKSSGTGIMW